MIAVDTSDGSEQAASRVGPAWEPLPERGLLFHIGLPKTATTALQNAAAAVRPELLANGVLYPGRSFSHRLAVNAFMGKGFGWKVDGHSIKRPPSRRHWDEMRREIDADHEHRIWFGHEYAAGSNAKQAAAWIEELGPRTHVVITMRPFTSMLPSLWQETLKRTGGVRSMDEWLRIVLKPEKADRPNRRIRHDHAAAVRRWATAAGAENVSVVILDPTDRAFVFNAFERMLALPEGLLAGTVTTDKRTNRSFTAPEAELVRRLNLVTRAEGLEWQNHEWLVYHGVVSRMLGREPGPAEAPLRLPAWADELAREQELRTVAAITETGVRVLGDLDNLVSKTEHTGYEDHQEVDSVPIDLAVQAIVGAVATATGRNASFVRTKGSVTRKFAAELAENSGPSIGAATSRFRNRVRNFGSGLLPKRGRQGR